MCASVWRRWSVSSQYLCLGGDFDGNCIFDGSTSRNTDGRTWYWYGPFNVYLSLGISCWLNLFSSDWRVSLLAWSIPWFCSICIPRIEPRITNIPMCTVLFGIEPRRGFSLSDPQIHYRFHRADQTKSSNVAPLLKPSRLGTLEWIWKQISNVTLPRLDPEFRSWSGSDWRCIRDPVSLFPTNGIWSGISVHLPMDCRITSRGDEWYPQISILDQTPGVIIVLFFLTLESWMPINL